MGAFYSLRKNTMYGVVQMDKIYLDVGKNFKVDRR